MHRSKIAEHVAKVSERGKVLYINTVQTERQLGSEIRRHINKDFSPGKIDPRITYLSSTPGLLNLMGKQILRILESGVRFIIINSLEFTAKDHRRKNELLFQIMDWTNIYGAAVLVFGEEANTDPITGKIHSGSGGVGKFSVIAKNVFHLTSPEEKKEIVDFDKSKSAVVIEDDDNDFEELDQRVAEGAHNRSEASEEIPDWEPENLEEAKALYAAYMKNHPELVFDESVILSNRRDYVMRLIAAEKKKQQRRERKQQVSQINLPDKPPVSSEAESESRARVLLM